MYYRVDVYFKFSFIALFDIVVNKAVQCGTNTRCTYIPNFMPTMTTRGRNDRAFRGGLKTIQRRLVCAVLRFANHYFGGIGVGRWDRAGGGG